MRILHVTPSLLKGGAEKVVIELSNGLTTNGHRVDLLLMSPVDPVLNQNKLDPRVFVRYISQHPTHKAVSYLKILFWVLRNWQTIRTYNVVHCHLTFGLIFGFYTSLFRHFEKHTEIKLVATYHATGMVRARFRRIFNEKLSYFFDEFILMAQDEQWRIFALRKKRKNISVIVNGISEESSTKRKKMEKHSSPWTIGTISRLQAERQPWLFLETFAQLDRILPGEFRFIIGGEGPERELLLQLSRSLDIESKLSMPGLVQEPVLIFEQLDFYLALNIESVTGIAGLEAIFNGVPTIGLQLSPTYVNGEEDWIWSDKTPSKVAAKIIDYLKSPATVRDLIISQGNYAREEFSSSKMLKRYLELYTRGTLDNS